ncbi:MAG: hypothetical protein WBP12_05605 [Candidatus Saccharimonas sp.]
MSGLKMWLEARIIRLMVQKTTKASTKKTLTKKPAKKSVSKNPSKIATTSRKASAPTRPKTQKVDYYPNRMTVAASALAGTILVLVAIIAVLGSRG